MKMLQDFTEEHLNICGWVMITLAIVSFISAFFLTTPYGRYSREIWGFGIHASAAWLLQECPSFIIPFGLFMSSDGVRKLITLDIYPNHVLVFMVLIHYFRRAFIYPFLIKTTAPTPFWIFVFALTFCSVNGFMQGHYHVYVGIYPKDWFSTWQFVFGSVLFFVGFSINIHSDYILTNLRKPGETGHKIPQGGLFQYVSCANFFGEIVEWGGFALASSSFVAFAFFFNTIFQIGTRACHHHRFYQEKFEDYPKNRKAVIPFIF